MILKIKKIKMNYRITKPRKDHLKNYMKPKVDFIWTIIITIINAE